tara:strand:- start:1522 stop:1758 length:237 start_codon:yes stop_codon:yes gene_type:complete
MKKIKIHQVIDKLIEVSSTSDLTPEARNALDDAIEELMDESGIMVPDWRMDISPEELEEIMYLECLFKDLYLNKIAMA